MGRVLDAWLGPFGFQADAPEGDAPAARGSQAVREPDSRARTRTRGPIIAPDDPSLDQHAVSRPTILACDAEPRRDRPNLRSLQPARPSLRPGLRRGRKHAAAGRCSEFAPSVDMRQPLRIEAPAPGPVDFGRRRRVRTSHRADGRYSPPGRQQERCVPRQSRRLAGCRRRAGREHRAAGRPCL